MKKVLIIISILLLAGAGYFTYEKWVKHSDLTRWSFVPSDAAVVFEGKLTSDLNLLKEFPLWSIPDQASGFKNLRQGLSFLDSINGEGGFTAIFEDAPAIASMHKVSSNSTDFLFVVELQNISQNTFANAAIGRLKEKGYRFRTRNYNDFKISEINDKGRTLTFIFYKNFFLGSFTPYLVEDAVRALSEDGMPSFKENFVELNDPGAGNFITTFINYEKTGELLEAFVSSEIDFPLNSGSYELAIDSSIVQLSGFSFASKDWLNIHNEQPSTFEMAEVVPNNAAFVYHFTSFNATSWKENQIPYLRTKSDEIKRLQDSLKSQYDFNVDQVFDLVDNEIGIINLESPRVRDRQKLMILEVKDVQESLNFFSLLTQRIAVARGDSVYTESYSDNEIRFLPIRNFPSTLLGEVAENFEQCFYISYKNYLIFSNDLQELKNLISSVSEEETWGKSIQMNDFLSRTNNAANVSLFVNVPRAWNNILTTLKPEWEEHFKQNSSVFKSLDLAAFQFSHLDGVFFTNYTFTQPVKKSRNIPKTDADNGVRFVSKLISKPHLVRTHAHREFDIILQDSTNTIYYLDPDQNALWTETIENPIVSSIYPLDYYKNGKIQYAFTTTTHIHLIDRTGTHIPGYPKELPNSSSIHHFNIIDYDLSRNYRMAITDRDGNVYLGDKDLKVLEGWNPRKFNRSALQPMNHARLGRKDIMISLQENGVVNIMNRRGEYMRGFPFDTKQSINKNYFLRQSNSLSNSSISVITEGGELTELNLEGDVIKRDQLIKTSADTKFRLIPDTGGDSFIILRRDGNSYEVLDDTGNLLFKKDYLSEGPVSVQYYQFGAGKDLVIFTDQPNNALYIYDKSGNLITGNPLNSEHEVSVIYSAAKREFQVFTTWDTNLELYTFNY
ncbi:hypothetical protein [Ekhidna sp.]|uniref:hypothetical protein n=1 Tax=Ekhidna sp. TaxID=2608089 RepID=UPI003BACA505